MTPAPDTARPGRALPILEVVVAVFFFALTPSLAAKAAQDGASYEALTLARFAVGAAVLLPWLAIAGRLPRLDLRLAGIVGITGLIYAQESYSYLKALDFIPVGLTVLIFYLHPLVVSAWTRFVDGQPVPPVRVLWQIVALAGVILATGAAPDGAHPLGIAFAAAAAVGVAVGIVLGGRMTREFGAAAYAGLSFGVAAPIMLLAGQSTGTLVWPAETLGWLWMGGACVTFLIGILLFFHALHRLDAVSATIVANLEPLFAIAIAWAVLGERLTPTQSLGAAIVMAAIILSGLFPRKGLSPAVNTP
ncbi:MAG TPA: DMT family transporter [Alphaproteobacteria bacterium]|nr:DMT family transporter [Alphaproteobacteria bacterium]